MPFNIASMKARLDELAERAPALVSVRCPVCQDSGVVATEIDGVIREARCHGCRRGAVANLPVPFRDVTGFDQVRPVAGTQRALQLARAFVSTKTPRDLLLHGPVGAGKTHLAIATAHEFAAAHRRSALFVRWPMTLHRLLPGSVDDDERRRLEHQLSTVPLLVVDDLGAERDEASDFTRRMAYLMYEARGDAGLRTIITSNLDLAELARHQADDRLTSRLAGRCDVARVDAADQRLARRLKAV